MYDCMKEREVDTRLLGIYLCLGPKLDPNHIRSPSQVSRAKETNESNDY